jgi:hypothetical protein
MAHKLAIVSVQQATATTTSLWNPMNNRVGLRAGWFTSGFAVRILEARLNLFGKQLNLRHARGE